MGGSPRDPKLIEAWIRSKTGVSDTSELRVMMLRHLAEMGAEVDEGMTMAELEAASAKVAGDLKTVGFKRGDNGLYIESRHIKAGLKEEVNILFEWQGSTVKQREAYGIKKNAKDYLAERVFVAPDAIWVGRTEPDGVEMFVGHPSGPNGKRSTLTYYEYVTRPEVTFDVLVTRDLIHEQWWPDIWNHFEENAIGALRSQGYGKFDILAWGKAD